MTRLALPLTVLVALTACFESSEPMTASEAREGMESSFESERGVALMTEPIEIGTHFTIGASVQAAAEEFRAWAQSQIPCSTATREGNVVTIDFGTLDDECVYNGHTYAGIWKVEIGSTESSSLQVSHTFVGLTNGVVTLDGLADVTWSAADLTRTVDHDVTWTDGAVSVEASGQRTQSLIDPEQGLAGGIEVEGDRDWTVSGTARGDGDWHLDIDGVQMRGQDPVPQAGTYTLTNPAGQTVSLTFTRLDEDSIQVDFDGLRRSYTIIVNSETGALEGDEPALE